MIVRNSIILYVGDIIAILLFAVLGRQTHDMPTGLGAFGMTLTTASPFIIAWLLVAPWFGAYRPQAWVSPLGTVKTVVIAFIPSFFAAILLRALFVGRFSPIPFYLVTAAVILTLLLVWRLLYTMLLAPRLSH